MRKTAAAGAISRFQRNNERACYTAGLFLPARALAVTANAFASLPLSAAMQANLAAIGYAEMTPIQAAGRL